MFSEEKEDNLEEFPIEEATPAEEAPEETTPKEEALEEATPAEETTPTEEAPEETTPTEEALEEATPAEETTPTEEDLEEAAPAEQTENDEEDSVVFDFIIGEKLGMTSIFLENGASMPCTVIQAGPCKIVQVKTNQKEGYSALQVGFGKLKKSNKAIDGHFNKAELKDSLKVLKEFKTLDAKPELLGKEISVNSFSEGEYVTVTGISKGKGFAGHMKRHNFSGGRASHGKNSVMRKAGSVGAGTWPGRVWPGTRMAGRMGGDKVTVENLKVLKVDEENNLLFVKGAIPGPSKSIVYIEK